MYQRADELLRELGISGINAAQPVMNYGGGHQQLIEIAKALNKRAKLLILDEPSSSLTSSEIRILLDIVRDLKRVNAHLAAAAYPVLEGRGELLPSRLKRDD